MKQRVTEEDQGIIRKSNSFIEAVWKRAGEPKNDGVDESKIFEIHGQHIGKSQLKAVVGTTQDQQAVVLALNYQTWTPSSHILKTVTKSLESEGQQWPPLWTGSRVYPRYLDKARDIAHALDATFFRAIMQSPADAQVYIVGRGKAAGVAQILAAMTLLNHMELISRRTVNVVLEFAPLVGNAAFRAIYNQLGVKTLRVYHRQTIFNVGPTAGAGYVPVGTEVFFAFKSGPPVYCPENLDTLYPDPDCSTWRL
ncbi:hypothetical protein IWQ60_002292 [Tieghemiomyces parasiticus]|uniref:Fungal lipase-type domain-containing protein n=1 Tax=Tieghemiomyces parasiticus TaxID=78921 RepID=A0A9W8ACE8_9FUNG|nr:hypothetical protein IWQ60_002292 [Tieghemiomyces parasiticus]